MSSCLILNKYWTPITTTSVYRAITIMCRNAAFVVCPVSYKPYTMDEWVDKELPNDIDVSKFIRSVNFYIEKPEIILLKYYSGVPYGEVTFNRKNLFLRDHNQCQYCGLYFSNCKLTIDHVIPSSKGGPTSFENCVSACYPCNVRKADRSLFDTKMKLVRKPIKPSWNPIVSFLPYNYPSSWNSFLKRHVSESK